MGDIERISSRGTLSDDPKTFGFDLSAGSKWIYPENYPKRDYQFSIVQTALFHNTLVCLPTGLGKTFIAAVVMFNFWRWYPKGKIVFLAPTKPLVAQQIEACHEIMGIPPDETVELTGNIVQTKRKLAWNKKRVIFATPQTFQKDLQKEIVPNELIRCIVFDEAHKALGKFAYSEIVKILSKTTKYFRIVGLSATPGSKIDQVREVVQNLHISELELRDDTSPDITPYINERCMKKIIVSLTAELAEFKERYIYVMNPHVRILVSAGILKTDVGNITKSRIFVLMNQYREKSNKAQNHGMIMKTFTILMTMYHAYELLLSYGLRAFCNFYNNHSDKFWIENEKDLKQLLQDARERLGDFPVINPLDDVIPEVPDNLVFGHDKFTKLKSILTDHFKLCKHQSRNTRAIVFVEYRDIVNEVYVLLLQCRPLIRPQMFVGQAGLKQKQQIKALENFRNDKVNVLISTSVGEEGLDVGEVDLIVCFDIASSGPTRFVQRIGRTGRKRTGNVVLLVTEGQELKTLNQALAKKDSLNQKVLASSNIVSSMYQDNPRMVPDHLNPVPCPIFIKAQDKLFKETKKKQVSTTGKRKKKNDINVEQNAILAELEECSNDQISEPIPSQPRPSPCKNTQKPKTVQSKNAKPISSNQPSLMKYFTGAKKTNTTSANDTIQPQPSTSSGEFEKRPKSRPNVQLKSNRVKLFNVDNDATEFLTLCTMKKSIPKVNSKLLHINTEFLPKLTKDENFFDFTVPSLSVLDCVQFLTEKIRETFIDDEEDSCNFNMIVPEADLYQPLSEPETLASTPPSVHKSFACLLDEDSISEYTDVESLDGDSDNSSRSPKLIEKNIFQDFLENSTDEEEETVLENNVTMVETDANEADITLQDKSTAKRLASSPQECAVIKKHKLSEIETNRDDVTTDATNYSQSIPLFDTNLPKEPSPDFDYSPSIPLFNSEFPENPNPDESNHNCSPKVPLSEARSRSPSIVPNESSQDAMDYGFSPSIPLCDRKMEKVENSQKVKQFITQQTLGTQNYNSDDDLFGESDNEGKNLIQKVKSESDDSDATFYDAQENFVDDRKDDFCDEETIKPSKADAEKPSKDDASKPFDKDLSKHPVEEFFDDDWSDFDISDLEKKENILPKTVLQEKSENGLSRDNSLRDYKNNNKNFQCYRVNEIENVQPVLQKPEPRKNIRLGLNLQKLKKNTTPNIDTTCDKDGFAIPQTTNSKYFPPKPKEKKEIEVVTKKKEKKKTKRKERRKARSNFIIDEAEISSDADTSEGSSGHEDDQEFEDSFVSYTQNVTDAVDMTAHYMRTVRSPVHGKRFVFKQLKPSAYRGNVYSQPVTQTDNTYVNDSFCVDEDEDEDECTSETSTDVDSPVICRKRSQHFSNRSEKKLKVRKLCHEMDSSSSEDETEKLRRQVMEESILQKR